MSIDRASQAIVRLLEIMAILRSPGGCPWDAEQTPETLRHYLVEETYEVLDAIDTGDPTAIREELGDLLLQIIFQSRIFEERGEFGMAEVAEGIGEKLVRRHPHVFAGLRDNDPASLAARWEQIKAEEKSARGKSPSLPPSALDGIPRQLPALRRARKIMEKATRAGFEWPDREKTLASMRSDLTHLERAMRDNSKPAQEATIGNLLFDLARLAHLLHLDAEDTLRQSINEFRSHFFGLEAAALDAGHSFHGLPPEGKSSLSGKGRKSDHSSNKK